MTYSIFIDKEGDIRRVIDGIVQPKPGLGIPKTGRNMQKGDFKLGPYMTEMQGERIIELLEDLVSLCQENLDQVVAEELKHHNAPYPVTTSYPGGDSNVSYPNGG